jgi:UDP-N-acetylmuramoylalanine--D-glutamate ligase
VETNVQETMAEAVLLAHKQACRNDVVLLSPGCASFDEFTDYKNRGNVFQDIVRRM